MRPILGDTVGDFGDGQAVPIEYYSASPKRTMAPTDYSDPAGAATYRIASYCACAIGLVILYVALRETTWQGTRGLHTTMEVAATLLSLVVGALALVHYYSRKNNTYLFIGTGFLGTAFLDAYHAVVTSEFISPYLPSDLPSLIPWSWIASRQFLSIMLCSKRAARRSRPSF